MELITKSLLKKLPPLYSTGDKTPEEIKIVIHLSSPWGAYDSYLFEYNPTDRIARAFVRMGDETEIGLISIDELEQVRGPMGLKIERAIYWNTNTRLSEIMKRYQGISN